MVWVSVEIYLYTTSKSTAETTVMMKGQPVDVDIKQYGKPNDKLCFACVCFIFIRLDNVEIWSGLVMIYFFIGCTPMIDPPYPTYIADW
jgi:hypothetical protein